ncbi:MAG TPA: hypothetical protein VFZ49_06260 [Pyrinomonadaceae bacterium]
MKIAKIVSSNSHIAYVARVLDARDEGGEPAADEYSFGRFVSIADGGERIVGVISDSRLVNPEYLSPSTRLGQASALGELRRDLVEDKRTLVAILLLGSMRDGVATHAIPLRVLPSGADVESMSDEDAAEFHRGPDNEVRLGYFPSLMSHSGPLSTTLAKTIIGKLSPHFSEFERQKLAVMADSLSWKQTFGDTRF